MALKGVTERQQGLLEAAGLWEQFCDYRKQFIAKGHDAADASQLSLAAWFQSPNEPRVPVAPEEPRTIPVKGPSDDEPTLEIAPAGLAGKTALEPEVARWVSRNIDNPAASPDDCPDPFAWTLLRMCRENPAFATMFVKDIWTKLLVSQARQGSDDIAADLDGKPTLELISRIRKVRDKATRGVEQRSARVVHGHEVAGSNPVSANSTGVA